MTKGADTPNPRRAVFRIAAAVLERGTPLDEALETAFAKAPGWDARDRAFTRNLAATLFRRLGAIDGVIAGFLEKPLTRKTLWLMHWLRIGTAQILFLDVPDHAAVNTTVTQIAKSGRPGAVAYKRLANAVLRNIARGKDAILKDLEANPEKNLPPWLWQRWAKTFGEKTARDIVRAQLEPPPLDVTLKDDTDAGPWRDKLKGEEIFPGTLRLFSAGRVDALPGFTEGAWWPQDLAASLPPRLLGDVAGKRALDLCAAPGGKTLYMASRGARVTAVDISKPRLQRVTENLQRTGLKADVVQADVLEYRPDTPFDLILLDAPCSATGTLRRHPDVPWHRSEADIARLSKIQPKLLERAFSFLAPGGALVYCVCSLEPEEGENLTARFLETQKDAARVPVTEKELAGHKAWITPAGDLRTLPSHLADKGGMDGFYAARITKA